MNGPISSLRIPRLALSLLLALWVGGAGCLIGCGNMAMAAMGEVEGAAPRDNTTVVAGESCRKAPNHSCCAKHHARPIHHQPPVGQATPGFQLKISKTPTRSIAASLLPTSGASMGMCPLAMNASALAAKVRTDEASTMTALSRVALPLVDSGRTFTHATPPAWFSNRGHTYLRCCVFLI